MPPVSDNPALPTLQERPDYAELRQHEGVLHVVTKPATLAIVDPKNAKKLTTKGSVVKVKKGDLVIPDDENQVAKKICVQIYYQKEAISEDRNSKGYISPSSIKPLHTHEPFSKKTIMKGKAKVTDILQGNLRNSLFHAALIAAVHSDADIIPKMFINETSTSLKTTHTVTVCMGGKLINLYTTIPHRTSAIDAHKRGFFLLGNGATWVRLLEKAFVINTCPSGYGEALDPAWLGKHEKDAFKSVFGAPGECIACDGFPANEILERIEKCLEHKDLLIVTTKDSDTPTARMQEQIQKMKIEEVGEENPYFKFGGLLLRHAYAIVGIDKGRSRTYVELYNPWGSFRRTKYTMMGKYNSLAKGALSYVELEDFKDACANIYNVSTAAVHKALDNCR
eukprot:m.345725 g.345725  ORF g.345725 m.345725 type:complete len:394 (-) comp27107_c0_seq1:188-1369(-)